MGKDNDMDEFKKDDVVWRGQKRHSKSSMHMYTYIHIHIHEILNWENQSTVAMLCCAGEQK